MLDLWIEDLSILIQNNIWFTPLLAVLAGLLTSVTPCSLTSVPLIIGYVSGTGYNDTKRAFRLSLIFSAGTAATYTTLGVFASLLGKLLHELGAWWHFALGIIMILMALQVFEIVNIIPSVFTVSDNAKKGYIGAYLAGMLGGLFASHCAMPVLIVLLAIAAEGGSIAWGLMLLLLYAAGHSVIILIAGTSMGIIKKMTGNQKYLTLVRFIKYIMGIVILLLGFYMFYLGLNTGF